jgi:FkbM family methyltransferase
MSGIAREIVRRSARHFPAFYEFQGAARRRLNLALGRVHDGDYQYFRAFRGKNATIIDVGANIGQSIASLSVVCGACTTHSFEPNPEVFRRLERFVRHRPASFVYNQALGSQEGVMRLHVPYLGRLCLSQLASLKTPDAAELCRVLRLWHFGNVSESQLSFRTFDVPIKTLDSHGLRPDAIKIDVEGAELEVLQGAVETLRKHKPLLMVEGSALPVVRYLRDMGYEPFFFRDGRLQPGPSETNTFFRVT